MVWDTLVSVRAQSGPLTYWLLWWTIAATFLAVNGVWWLTRTASQASTLWVHVQSFDKYVASVPSEFRNLEVEAKAREKLRLISGNTVPSQ